MALSVRPQFRQWDRVGHARSTLESQFGFGQAIGENTISGFLSSYGAGTIARELMTPQPNVPITDEAPFLSELPRAVGEIGSMIRGDKPEPTISVEEFKASTDYREAIPYETGMTKSRLAALSAMYDVNQARAMMSQKEWGGAFIGQFLGQAGDPINYVPFAGGAMQTAAVARLGGVLGRVSVAALDAAVNTAIFGAATADWRRKFGDAVTFEAIAQEVGMSMVIGGVFGAGMGLLSIPGDRRARDAAMIDAAASRMDGLRDVQGRMAILSDNTSRLARGEDMNPSARIEFERQAAKFQDEIRKQEEVDIKRVVDIRTVAERADLVAVRTEMGSTPADAPRRVELAQRQVELEDRIQRIDLAYRAQRELVARGVVADGVAPIVRDLPAPAEGTTRIYTQTDPQGAAPVAATVEAPADGKGWYVDVPAERAAELTARPIEPPSQEAAAAPNVQPITWQSLPKPELPPVSPFRRLMINRFMEGGRSGEEGLALAKTFEAAYANLSARAGWTPEKMLQEYPLPEVVYRGPERTPEPKAEEGVPVFDDGKPHFYDGADEKSSDGEPLASETEMLFAPARDPNAGDFFQAAPPVDSPEFQAWFGDSKVVDENGAPLVVYRGSKTVGAEQFDPNRRTEKTKGTGVWFSSDREAAGTFAGGDGEVYPVYLSLKNPVVVEWNGHWTDGPETAEYRVMDANGVWHGRASFDTEAQARTYAEGEGLEGFDVEPTFGSEGRTTDEFVRRMREQHPDADGIILKNVAGGGEGAGGFADMVRGDEYVAFSPTQIKSIANRGTFDPNDPRILYQPSPETVARMEQEVRDDASTWQRDDGTSTETPRGQISFKDGKSLIKLFDGADPSTALHEAGHHFLMMIKDMGERTDVGPGIKEDWGTVKGWLAVNAKDVATEAGNGVTPDDVLAVLNRNTSGDRMKDIAINRGIHEQWARGFEAYHLEGKAPSVGMRGVFESFRKWLAAIYASVKSLNVNLTPEIRQVFDRLLTDEPTPEIGIVTAPERPAGAPTLDPPPPPPVDPALARAAAAVGKSEDIAGFEEQLGARVDGTYNEEGDIDMLRSLGRILPDEETALKAADDGYKDAVAYEKMLQVALACVIP